MESIYIYFLKLKKDYVIGSGPFCDGQPSDCDIPGYVPGKKVKSGCWTGQKQECAFDMNAYKQSWLYKEVVDHNGEEFANNHIPKFHSRGVGKFKIKISSFLQWN